jgi:hypothetical protein
MGKAMGEVGQQLEPSGPETVPVLLRTLHIDDTSVQAQRVALRGWLIDHPPSKALRISLRCNGYGVLLRGLGAEGRPMPPITATHKVGA